MFVLVAIVGLLATASAKDIIVGDGGELIYNQNITASPSVWVRKQNVTVESPEEITRVVVIDNREDKNGEAEILEGGVGFNNVTIELKSPAVFRGFYFEIQVYAKSEGVQIPVDKKDTNLNQDAKVNENQIPNYNEDMGVKGFVSQVPISTTSPLPFTQSTESIQHPVATNDNNQQQTEQNVFNPEESKITENTYVHPMEVGQKETQFHTTPAQEKPFKNGQSEDNFDKLIKEVKV